MRIRYDGNVYVVEYDYSPSEPEVGIMNDDIEINSIKAVDPETNKTVEFELVSIIKEEIYDGLATAILNSPCGADD